MAIVEMVMPSMGESIMEGTILQWLKKEGDFIEEEDSVLEVATDKVDTEVPAVQSGVLKEILIHEGEVAQVGKPIAMILQNDNQDQPEGIDDLKTDQAESTEGDINVNLQVSGSERIKSTSSDRFYSPLVKNIAKTENISFSELDAIKGTGKEGRVTKRDILAYINTKVSQATTYPKELISTTNDSDEIIEMDRMRKMIAERMLNSKAISAHVTSFVEADVTNLVAWRNRVKHKYKEREGESLTFTPIFMEAVALAIKDFPMINISVQDSSIIRHKDINIGMAVALNDGNLIVPTIKKVDRLSLVGLSKQVNDLAQKARDNKLKADDLTGGTYTLSNIGSFGNIMGTPIIMQPQVAILAIGSITKKPSVVETPTGDAIAIRHKMYLSHSYDHRVVDGALGGRFVKRVADLLEAFDTNRTI